MVPLSYRGARCTSRKGCHRRRRWPCTFARYRLLSANPSLAPFLHIPIFPFPLDCIKHISYRTYSLGGGGPLEIPLVLSAERVLRVDFEHDVLKDSEATAG